MDSEDSDLMWDEAIKYSDIGNGIIDGGNSYHLVKNAAAALGLVRASSWIHPDRMSALKADHRAAIEEQIIKMRLKDG